MNIAYQPHSDTSRATAGKIESSSKKQAAMIETWADGLGWHGVTIDEGIVFLSEKFGRDMQASPRFKQLEDAKRLVKTDRKRLTRAGHPATVYVLPCYKNDLSTPTGVINESLVRLGADQPKGILVGSEVGTVWLNEAGQIPVESIAAIAPRPSRVEPEKTALQKAEDQLALTGHGYVIPRRNGFKSRCGGPNICATCKREKEYLAQLRDRKH